MNERDEHDETLLDCSDCHIPQPPTAFFRSRHKNEVKNRGGRGYMCRTCNGLRAQAASKAMNQLRKTYAVAYDSLFQSYLSELRQNAQGRSGRAF